MTRCFSHIEFARMNRSERYNAYERYGRLGGLLRKRTIKDRSNPIEEYDDIQFFRRFRFSRESVFMILEEVKDKLTFQSLRNSAVPPLLQLLIALRFYATGSFQMTDGDLFGVHQSTAGRIVHRVSTAISELRPKYITFPSEEEQQRIKRQFYGIKEFPGVIGCIDGTHVELSMKPDVQCPELFRNRKNRFSINVQVLFDAELSIRDIVTRWYGSAHDARIFRESLVNDKLQDLPPHTWILGDSGYPCLPYLITPFLNPVSDPQRSFNISQKITRNVAERGIGCWKRRFPCLKVGLSVNVQRCPNIIVSTAVLHNIAVQRRESGDIGDIFMLDVQPDAEHDNSTDIRGTTIRNEIVRSHFL